MTSIGIILLSLLLVHVCVAFRPLSLRQPLKSSSLLNMVAQVGDKAFLVEGNEGLLDTNRMQRAYEGTGINVPADKQMTVGIIGGGLAGMITAMELADAGHKVEIYESRRFIGGKVGSWVDKDNNHVEMGLHVFFGCYYNLFGIMKRVNAFQHLRLKEHSHQFVNKGGWVGELDFRLGGIGAPINGLAAFARSSQLGEHSLPSLCRYSLPFLSYYCIRDDDDDTHMTISLSSLYSYSLPSPSLSHPSTTLQ